MALLAGPLLVLATIATYLAALYTGRLPRALWQIPWPSILAAGLGVAEALRIALRRRGRRAWAWAAVTGALALLFVGGLPLATRLPAVGAAAPRSAAPDFTLPSTDGGEVTLSSLRGRKVVLVFHRGHW